MQTKTILLAQETDTSHLAAELAKQLTPSCIVYLQGPLGVGKTTFVRAFLRALGYSGPVRSPSYTLTEEYAWPNLKILHLDLYRITDPQAVEFLGLRDAITPQTIAFIEWPEHGKQYLPSPDITIQLEFTRGERQAIITFH